MIADRLGLPLEQVSISDYGDSFQPGGAYGRRLAADRLDRLPRSSAAHRELVAELLKLAGNDTPLAGLTADEVGGLRRRSCQARRAGAARELRLDPGARAARRAGGRGRRAAAAGVAALVDALATARMFCEVGVNAVTGEMRVRRFLGSFDCGRILNPKTAASQFRGGIIMGLGLALMEETQFDDAQRAHHEPEPRRVPRARCTWTCPRST